MTLLTISTTNVASICTCTGRRTTKKTRKTHNQRKSVYELITVILCCLSFRVGANISDEQREYAWSIHRSAGLFKEGIKQFRKALDEYEPGKPYDFEEIGLYHMLELKTKYDSKFPP